MRNQCRSVVGAVAILALFTVLSPISAEQNWPEWRGPLGTGVAPDAAPPTTWSEKENIKWKIKLPGKGSATPIVWGDKIFIQSAINTGKKQETAGGDQAAAAKETASAKESDGKRDGPVAQRGGRDLNSDAVKRDGAQRDAAKTDDSADRGDANRGDADRGNAKRDPAGDAPPRGPGGRGGFGGRGRGGSPPPTEVHQFVLLCLDRGTGKTLWQKAAREEVPHEGHHAHHGYASHSPVTDGEHVIAYFGSRGLHCYDLNGNLKWSKDLGRMRTPLTFGEGSSPALHGNTVVVNWDHEGEDFIAAFDKATGEELWRQPRDERTTWSTPLIVEHDGQAQVITGASGKIRSYDLRTGKQLWEAGGLTANVIPSPVSTGDMVYLMSGFRGNSLKAIRLGASGDVEETDSIVWRLSKRTPYVPSPLLYDNRLYFVSGNNAILSCYDAKTGEPVVVPEGRIEGLSGIYASPVAAAGRVYVVGRNGATAVIKHAVEPAEEFEILATNELDEGIDASPAIVDNEIFLRGQEHLYCIAEK